MLRGIIGDTHRVVGTICSISCLSLMQLHLLRLDLLKGLRVLASYDLEQVVGEGLGASDHVLIGTSVKLSAYECCE